MGTDPRFDLSGDWLGHYVQHGNQTPLRATLTQDGEVLNGTMWDDRETRDVPLGEVALEEGWAPGQDERLVTWLREFAEEDATAEIRAISILPNESQLSGTVRGDQVRFVKEYQGTHMVGYRVGKKIVGETREQHRVNYVGRIHGDGSVIEGRWMIGGIEEGDPLQGSGEFLLQRDETRSTARP